MPLTLVTTPGAADANAYADLASVQAFAAYRGGAGQAFLDLTVDEQIQAIATTALAIDPLDYIGTRATSTQALAWPRTGTDYDGVPLAVIRANTELAITRAPEFTITATTSSLNPQPNAVRKLKVGPIELTFPDPVTPTVTSLIPATILGLLKDVLRASTPGAGAWGSATVVRVA